MSEFNDSKDFGTSKSRSDSNQNQNQNQRYAMNFAVSHNLSSRLNHSMASNIISETSLEDDFILLKKKSLLKRKFISSEKIYYSEIIDLKLNRSKSSSIASSIDIVYSRNSYSKRTISLSSSDIFAMRWFYDALVVRYSYIRSNLSKMENFNSNELEYENKNLNEAKTHDFDENNDDLEANDFNSNLDSDFNSDLGSDSNSGSNSVSNLDLDSNLDSDENNSKDLSNDKSTKQSKLSDFMELVGKPVSKKREEEIKRQMKFQRCSGGEY